MILDFGTTVHGNSWQYLGGIPGMVSITCTKERQHSLLSHFHWKNRLSSLSGCLTGLFPAVQSSSSGFPSVHTDTRKIKAANLPSPRTDGAVSEGKSQKVKLGSLSKTQTEAFTEDMTKLCFCFQKRSFLPPLLRCYHQQLRTWQVF